MKRLVVIDGNSILNRAFYGIMSSKMLMTSDGTYTNAVYGFLSIMFKILEDLKPEYLVVAFDLKGPTKRHEKYEGYKATRKGMPDELASQLPIIKEVLQAMNIKIVEKQGYEADDILGTYAKSVEKEGVAVTLLTGDRDSFQLASENITIRLPRTKMGKTEEEDFNKDKIIEVYGVEPAQLIEVKGLMGDTSDNIPGVPGVGEKTAISLIKEYSNIDNIYKELEKGVDNLKGKLKENLLNNKELAYLSKELGTIDINVPIDTSLNDVELKQWDNEKVLELFKKLKFNRFIDRFGLSGEFNGLKEAKRALESLFDIKELKDIGEITELINIIKEEKKLVYYLTTADNSNECDIIKKTIISIDIYSEKKNTVYYIDIKNENIKIQKFKDLFEDNSISKYGYKIKQDYILLKQQNIQPNGYVFDAQIAGYILNTNISKYSIEDLALEYIQLDIQEYLESKGIKDDKNKKTQISLFEEVNSNSQENSLEKEKHHIYAYCINEVYKSTINKMKENNLFDLFNEIEIPTARALAEMQFIGIYVDLDELIIYGKALQERIEILTKQIYESCNEEFNINSPKQLGEILFEKLELPVIKKNKSGYSTDVDVLEKLKTHHPIIEMILEYRQLMKLNSTYVEGMVPYINNKTHRIHSYFHQTVTATGRISSTEPNLQNIPTRFELGKKLRKIFKAEKGKIFLDADYSQIELRILAHIAKDDNMIRAFNNDEDIHIQAAATVLNKSLNEVTKEERSEAKAVNFGIVYGISDYGLSEQLGISVKKAKEYIEQYLDKYSGIKTFMNNITQMAKEKGYVETLFNRRRYIPELSSNNYMVRQFGKRAALNTPIQGTAADIMKIAMINIDNELRANNLKSQIVLQVHDELLIETEIEEKEKVKEILKNCMENVIKLEVPLKVDITDATSWYEAK